MLRNNLITSAILGLALILTGSAFGQGKGQAKDKMRRGEAQDGSGTDNANKQPGAATANPIGLAGPPPLGTQKRNRKVVNLGDTATHEVGHKGKRTAPQFRSNPTGEGATQRFRNAKFPNAAKYDGIDEESNDTSRKKPNAAGHTQNLLPYMEQDSVYKNSHPKLPTSGRRAKPVK